MLSPLVRQEEVDCPQCQPTLSKGKWKILITLAQVLNVWVPEWESSVKEALHYLVKLRTKDHVIVSADPKTPLGLRRKRATTELHLGRY